MKLLSAKKAIIDGEIAALNDEGKSSFQLLQSYGKAKQIPLVYYAFDLLFLEGADLRARPLVERRKLLADTGIQPGSYLVASICLATDQARQLTKPSING